MHSQINLKINIVFYKFISLILLLFSISLSELLNLQHSLFSTIGYFLLRQIRLDQARLCHIHKETDAIRTQLNHTTVEKWGKK